MFPMLNVYAPLSVEEAVGGIGMATVAIAAIAVVQLVVWVGIKLYRWVRRAL